MFPKAQGELIVLESGGSTLSDGEFMSCRTPRAESNSLGYSFGEFTLTINAFSDVPTGAFMRLYERKYTEDGQSPRPDANYPHTLIGEFSVKAINEKQSILLEAPIFRGGAQYYVEWISDGAKAQGWTLKLRPVTYRVY